MKAKAIISFLLLSLFVLTSCQSNEEKVIKNIQHLSDRIEKEGANFDVSDWQEAFEDLADIHEDIQDCDFTKEQLKELGVVEGRLSAIIIKEGSKTLSKSVVNALDNFSIYLSGFKEALSEDINFEDLDNADIEITDILNSISEELQ